VPGTQLSIPPAEPAPGFTWFPGAAPTAIEERQPRQVPEPAVARTGDVPIQRVAPAGGKGDGTRKTASPGQSATPDRGGLRRRVAGAQLPDGSRVPSTGAGTSSGMSGTLPVSQPRQQDPAALRGALDGFQAAFAKVAKEFSTPPPARATSAPKARTASPDGRRGGLTRRVPGNNMASGLRKPVAGQLPARMTSNWQPRDPDADRAKLDSFSAGLAHAATSPATVWPAEHLDTEKDTEKPRGTNR